MSVTFRQLHPLFFAEVGPIFIKILIMDEVNIRLSLCLSTESIIILHAFFESPIPQII